MKGFADAVGLEVSSAAAGLGMPIGIVRGAHVAIPGSNRVLEEIAPAVAGLR